MLIIVAMLLIVACSEKEEVCDCSQYEVTAAKNGKVTVCHDGKTLEIGKNALQAHLDHGDTLGDCSTLGVEDIEYDPCKEWCRNQE